MSLTPVTLRNATDTFIVESRPSENYADSTRLRVNNTTSAHAYTLIYFARPFPLGATVTSATLRVYADASAGNWSAISRTITASAITASWKASTVTYNTPAAGGPPFTTTGQATWTSSSAVTDGQQLTFDVTTMLANVASGTAWYGIRLDINESALRKLYSSQSATGLSGASFKPTLDVTYSLPPAAPTTLSPSGGRSTSSALPTLRFDYTDTAGNTALQAVQAQLNATNSFGGAVDYDTGVVVTSSPQVDLTSLLTNKVPSTFGNAGTFDTDINNWAAITNCSVSRITTPTHSGAGALQMSSSAAGTMVAGTPAGTSGIPVVGGSMYSVTGFNRTAATGRLTRIILDWADAAGVFISSTNGTQVTDTTSYVQRVCLAAVAPANAAFLRIKTEVASTGAGAELHYWDTFVLTQGSAQWSGVADGSSEYWRVQVQDASGQWSGYSAAALFARTSDGTLTITNPAAPANNFVTEATPPITWTFSGRTQAAYQVIIQDSAGDQWLHTSGKITGTALAYTLPAKVLNPSTPYNLVVRVWDTNSRESVPGDPAYVEATRSFTYTPQAGVSAVTAFTGTDLTPEPGIQLDWTSTTAPDSFTIIRDSKVIAAGILPGDVFVSGTQYRYKDRGADPRVSHTWEVRRVVNGATSTSNPTVVATIAPQGIWLMDEARDIRQIIMGNDPGTWGMGEQAAVYEVLGATRVVRVTQAMRGYEGSISGTIGALASVNQTLAQAEANMWDLKRRAGQTYRLVVSNLAFSVVIGNVVIAPNPNPDLTKNVSFDFWQVDDLDFDPVL